MFDAGGDIWCREMFDAGGDVWCRTTCVDFGAVPEVAFWACEM